MMVRAVRVLWLAALAMAAGCSVGPRYSTPDAPVRPHYDEARPLDASTAPQDSPRAWWAAVDEGRIRPLAEAAVQSNRDLRIALARVEEVAALRGVAASLVLPGVDVVGSASRLRESANSVGEGFDTPRTRNRFAAGLEVSWEVDLWGRVRRSVEAADADVAAAADLAEDAARSIVADVVVEVVRFDGASAELDVTRRNIELQRRSLAVVSRQFDEGFAGRVDVARIENLLRRSEASVPLLEADMSGAVHRLSVLTALDPAETRERLAAPGPTAMGVPAPPVGVPSELLRERPDIRASERELAAATARVGVATADLLPRISLTGSFGVESSEVESLFQRDSISFGVGPALRWPLLDWGRTRAEIRAQGARQRQALARYEQRVITAVAEVETALATLRARTSNVASLGEAQSRARDVERIVGIRLREGTATSLELLDAQRELLGAEAELARASTAHRLAYVSLCRALGLAWSEPSRGPMPLTWRSDW